jgi:hypothetical protein
VSALRHLPDQLEVRSEPALIAIMGHSSIAIPNLASVDLRHSTKEKTGAEAVLVGAASCMPPRGIQNLWGSG